MIRFEHVFKRYAELTAVNDLDFEIPEGQVCVLIGPSGCGKTTTMRMINRLIEPSQGRILIDARIPAPSRPPNCGEAWATRFRAWACSRT